MRATLPVGIAPAGRNVRHLLWSRVTVRTTHFAPSPAQHDDADVVDDGRRVETVFSLFLVEERPPPPVTHHKRHGLLAYFTHIFILHTHMFS